MTRIALGYCAAAVLAALILGLGAQLPTSVSALAPIAAVTVVARLFYDVVHVADKDTTITYEPGLDSTVMAVGGLWFAPTFVLAGLALITATAAQPRKGDLLTAWGKVALPASEAVMLHAVWVVVGMVVGVIALMIPPVFKAVTARYGR